MIGSLGCNFCGETLSIPITCLPCGHTFCGMKVEIDFKVRQSIQHWCLCALSANCSPVQEKQQVRTSTQIGTSNPESNLNPQRSHFQLLKLNIITKYYFQSYYLLTNNSLNYYKLNFIIIQYLGKGTSLLLMAVNIKSGNLRLIQWPQFNDW